MHPDAGMLWKILSVALVRQGKDALQALRRAAELMPQDAEAHGNLGAACYDQGQWAEALVSLRGHSTSSRDDVDALVDAADAHASARATAQEAVPLYRAGAADRSAAGRGAQQPRATPSLELASQMTRGARSCYRLRSSELQAGVMPQILVQPGDVRTGSSGCVDGGRSRCTSYRQALSARPPLRRGAQ